MKSNTLQNEIQSWWQNNPMTYDWHGTNRLKEGSKEWFEEVNKRFFNDNVSYFAQEKGEKPFSKLIPFETIKNKKILEIGCGSGAHLQLLLEAEANVTAIDLTPKAIELSKKRLEVYNLKADVLNMDAEVMEFPDSSFDFVWSWGVIHHSANTSKICSEIARVLKPGGEVRAMVYHWGSISWFVSLLRGLFSGKLFKLGVEETLSFYTDGRVAKYYRVNELTDLFFKDFEAIKVNIFGQKSELLPIPGKGIIGKVKYTIISIFPDFLANFILCKFGGFLFISAVKRK